MWITELCQCTPNKKHYKEDKVSVYIHKNAEFKIRNDLNNDRKDIESVGVELLHEKGETLY